MISLNATVAAVWSDLNRLSTLKDQRWRHFFSSWNCWMWRFDLPCTTNVRQLTCHTRLQVIPQNNEFEPHGKWSQHGFCSWVLTGHLALSMASYLTQTWCIKTQPSDEICDRGWNQDNLLPFFRLKCVNTKQIKEEKKILLHLLQSLQELLWWNYFLMKGYGAMNW